MVMRLDDIAPAPGGCPGCGATGSSVGKVTLETLVVPEKRSAIGPGPYFFCESPVCDVVYFSADGGSTFGRSDLSVRVGIKETEPPRPVCYCFGHTIEEIEDEVRRTGGSTVADDIRARMKSEGCSCETKSPRGSCCLSTVERITREATDRYGGSKEGEMRGGKI